MKNDLVNLNFATDGAGFPSIDQFTRFAERAGVLANVSPPRATRLARRNAIVSDVRIGLPKKDGQTDWRLSAPVLVALGGPGGQREAAELASTLAWLRFCDLAALPRNSGHAQHGWDSISASAVADHVCFMLDVGHPDADALERSHALWRKSSSLDGIGKCLSSLPDLRSTPIRGTAPAARGGRREMNGSALRLASRK